MRITRDLLLKLARDSAQQQVRQNRQIVCIYLTGSLLDETPLLGGATDIDLVVIHPSDPPQPRQVLPITDDIHLDLAHYSQSAFHQPRRLRADAWLGSYLCDSTTVLHDTGHWFEFTQASVCAQFHHPENRLQRARPLTEAARQIWMRLMTAASHPTPVQIMEYFSAVEKAANAVALLSGPPLTERRFVLNFPRRCQIIKRPGLAAGFTDLFANSLPADIQWESLTAAWVEALHVSGGMPSLPPARLHPCRINYYQRAVQALQVDEPAAALWILLRTWALAACSLMDGLPDLAVWKNTCRDLGFAEDSFPARLQSLDSYLDAVDETLEAWAKQNGVA